MLNASDSEANLCCTTIREGSTKIVLQSGLPWALGHERPGRWPLAQHRGVGSYRRANRPTPPSILVAV